MREKRVGRKKCELILGQSLPADHEYADGFGVDTPCGDVSTREIIVIVPALTGHGALSPMCATELPPIGW